MKFDEAYYAKTDQCFTIDQLNEMFEKDMLRFQSLYESELKCPECHFAPLNYVHASPPYLRTLENRPHTPGCSMEQNIVSTKAMEKYCNNKENYEAIYLKLTNIVKQCLINRKIDFNNHPFLFDKKPKNSFNFQNSGSNNKHNYISRHNLSLPFKECDYSVYKIFYGTVALAWLQRSITEKWSHIILKILSPETNKTLCSLVMTPNVYSYISQQVPLSEKPDIYHISFLAPLELEKERFSKAFIKHSCFFVSYKANPSEQSPL